MKQNGEQLNSDFEEIPKEIRANRNNNLINDEVDAENIMLGSFSSETKLLWRKRASNIETDKYESQELRQLSTPFEVVNETLDDTIVITEKRPEADYHNTLFENWLR